MSFTLLGVRRQTPNTPRRTSSWFLEYKNKNKNNNNNNNNNKQINKKPHLSQTTLNQIQPCALFWMHICSPKFFPAQSQHTHGLYLCIKYKINKKNNKIIIKKTAERIIES